MTQLCIPAIVKKGFRLALIVALAAFVSRIASAQQVTPPMVTADTVVHLSLAESVRLAARQNASVESARVRVDAAQARVTQRRADLLPTVSGAIAERGGTQNSATFPIEFPSIPGQPAPFDRNGSTLGPINIFDARARVSQMLFDPAARARVQGARTGVDAATADVASAADLAAANAANVYLLALRADAVYTARVQDSTLAAELLGIAQDQLRAGTGVALDVTRARSQLASSRAQLIIGRNERERSRVELSRAVGLPLVRIELSDALAALNATAPATEVQALETAFANRKDLQTIALQVRAARQQAAAIRIERLPTVGVFADEGLSQRNGRSFLPTYDWGIQLSLPIFDGNRREGRVAEQVAAARDLEVRERDLRAQVQADVRTALLNLRSFTEGVAAARERLALAEQEVAQARERFQAGVAGNADVITASLTLNSARTQLVDALTSYQGARVALARAEGAIATLD